MRIGNNAIPTGVYSCYSDGKWGWACWTMNSHLKGSRNTKLEPGTGRKGRKTEYFEQWV